MWSREHAEPFDCIDDNGSKLLVTTRSATAVLPLWHVIVPFVLGSRGYWIKAKRWN